MDSNSDLNSVSTPKRRGGARPGAGRPKKEIQEPSREEPTRESQIEAIQRKLAENPPAREYAALAHVLARLTGALKTYQRTKADQQPEPQVDPESLPTWWSDRWARIFISERARGPAISTARWHRELDRYEADWAKQENLTVEQLRDQLRREHREWKAQHSPEEQLAMCREHLESLRQRGEETKQC